ncbi:MAG: hypothetical protein F6K42_18850 [Leptolyngbya sp. SIO1D8]|nr:hypothetical protein [Leptolyngbya sp. SIO1D8]
MLWGYKLGNGAGGYTNAATRGEAMVQAATTAKALNTSLQRVWPDQPVAQVSPDSMT